MIFEAPVWQLFVSLFVLISGGWLVGKICEKIHVPPLMGYVFFGLIFGPTAANVLPPQLFDPINHDSAKTFLLVILSITLPPIVILGIVNLDTRRLKGNYGYSVLHGTLTVVVEVIIIALMAKYILNFPWMSATFLGLIISATSPAIVMPFMRNLKRNPKTQSSAIPDFHIASGIFEGSFTFISIRILIAIQLFLTTGTSSAVDIAKIPVLLISTIIFGIAFGYLFFVIHHKTKMNDYLLFTLIVLSVICLLNAPHVSDWTSPISIIFIAIALMVNLETKDHKRTDIEKLDKAAHISSEWSKIILFTVIGASVNFGEAKGVLGFGTLIMFVAIIAKMATVFVVLIGSKFTINERVFSSLAVVPKATWQASMGGVPLAIGTLKGNDIASLSILSILIFASIGSIALQFGKRLLESGVKVKALT